MVVKIENLNEYGAYIQLLLFYDVNVIDARVWMAYQSKNVPTSSFWVCGAGIVGCDTQKVLIYR